MCPRPIWLAVHILAVAVAALAGCGLDKSLTCGPACDPDARFSGGRNGASDPDAVAPVDSPQEGETESSDNGEAGDSTTSRVDDGAMPMDSAVGESGDGSDGVGGGSDGGCQVCGQATCCLPQECASNNRCCLAVGGGLCGGDNGSPCCAGLFCTTAQFCATSCKSVGSGCADDRDCCQGMSYCDIATKTCAACRPNNVGCTAHDQCCSGHCNAGDAGNTCRGGG